MERDRHGAEPERVGAEGEASAERRAPSGGQTAVSRETCVLSG
jgi:hypothetical protein